MAVCSPGVTGVLGVGRRHCGGVHGLAPHVGRRAAKHVVPSSGRLTPNQIAAIRVLAEASSQRWGWGRMPGWAGSCYSRHEHRAGGGARTMAVRAE